MAQPPGGWQTKPVTDKLILNMSGSLKPLFGGLIPSLDTLTRKAAAARSLTDKVRAELAEPLRPHLVSAARRDADLVVIMDSAAWTPRVRYGAQTLKARLEASGEPAIAKVRVKVRGKGITDSG
jgi:hypothetical protein